MRLQEKIPNLWRCAFFNSAATVTASRQNAYRYDEVVSGLIIYAYVLGNPLSYVDPMGLATYVANRNFSAIGSSPQPWWNTVSHTYTFSTNPDGSIAATYSWGNEANLTGWNLNQPEDMKAAADALKNGDARTVGPDFMDPYYRKAFDELKDPKNEHSNGILSNNCKTEAEKLNNRAWDLWKK